MPISKEAGIGSVNLKDILGVDVNPATEDKQDDAIAHLAALAGAVSGSEVQVDIVSGGGGGTEYTEDVVAPANPVGGALLMTRDDILSAVAEAEGDWSRARGTAEGALWVQDFNSDAILALLGTIDADTGAIKTAIEILDNAIAGSEMQCDIVAALPAGANKIGDTGLLGNSVADGSGTDYHVLIDAAGHLQIDVVSVPSTVVTATNLDIRALVNTDVVTAELSAVDNAVLDAIDAVLDTINAKLVSGTDIGDVTINNAAGAAAVNIQDGGNSITVDGAFYQATQPISAAALPLPTGAATSAKQDTIIGHIDTVETILGTIDADTGAIKTAVELIDNAISGTEMQVDVVAALPAGDNNIGNVDIVSGILTTLTGSGVAHDGADSGNPHKIGGRAQEPTAQPDEVADNDRVDTLHDRVGRVATYQGYPRWYAAINCATSGNNTIKAAAGAGKKIVVTSVTIISDGTVDIRWESGADGTALSGQMPLQVREGYSASDPHGLFETAANALLNLELSAATNVHGHISGVIIDD